MPIPDKSQLRRFCELDGWDTTNAQNPDHDRYRKHLDSGDILRTKVSHGRGPVCDDISLWNRIWRHQLGLDCEQNFWDALSTRQPARRKQETETPMPPPAGSTLPTWLFEFLTNTIGVSEDDALSLTEHEAMDRYLTFVSQT